MRWLPAIGIALLASLSLAACGGSNEEAAPPPQTTTAETEVAEERREPAPSIAGESLAGEAIALGDFRGRPVLVNVWSSW